MTAQAWEFEIEASGYVTDADGNVISGVKPQETE